MDVSSLCRSFLSLFFVFFCLFVYFLSLESFCFYSGRKVMNIFSHLTQCELVSRVEIISFWIALSRKKKLSWCGILTLLSHIYLCGLAAKLFCATSYFPGAAPSKSPVKQHTDTNHSVMLVRWFAGTFRSSAGGLTFRWRPTNRQFIVALTHDHNYRVKSPQRDLWTRSV